MARQSKKKATTAKPRRPARRNSNTPAQQPTNKSVDTPVNKRRVPHNMSEEKRKLKLEADEWIVAGSVRAGAVTCAGCQDDKALDNRGTFYAGFWTKHKGRCPEIKIELCMRKNNCSREEAMKHLEAQAQARRRARQALKKAKEAREGIKGTTKKSPARRRVSTTPRRPRSTQPRKRSKSATSETATSQSSSATPNPSECSSSSGAATSPVRGKKDFHLNPIEEAPAVAATPSPVASSASHSQSPSRSPSPNSPQWRPPYPVTLPTPRPYYPPSVVLPRTTHNHHALLTPRTQYITPSSYTIPSPVPHSTHFGRSLPQIITPPRASFVLRPVEWRTPSYPHSGRA